MKKALVLSFIVAYAFSTLEAQIEVKTDGSVQVGLDSYYSNDNDFTITNVHQTGIKYSYSGFRMDNYNNFLHLNKRSNNYRNEIIWYSNNEARWHLGMDDSDDSQDNGDNLFIGQSIGGSNPFLWFDENAVIGMFTNNPDLSYRLTISGYTLSRYGYWQSSDANLKDNVNKIESALDKLNSIRGVTYKHNNNFAALIDFKESVNQNRNYIDSAGVIINNDTKRTVNPFSENQYGVIAQEVMQQFPDLVHKGSDGYYSVNYTGLIPVLLEAIKEQQVIIEGIQGELSEINGSNLKSLSTKIEDIKSSNTPILYQNAPNPFNRESSIRYRLPASITYAILSVYDLRGKLLRSYKLDPSMGVESAIIITAGEFQPGMYLYSLIVDNRLIDTKEMVITE